MSGIFVNRLRLCLVTRVNQVNLDGYISFLDDILPCGITMLQLRVKNVDERKILREAQLFKELAHKHNVLFMVNDYVHIAKAVDADGVHLGQQDMSPSEARSVLGDDKIIGLSLESHHNLYSANKLDCIDYVSASAVFPTTGKQDCKYYWGSLGLRYLVKRSVHPVMAIGGINIFNIGRIAGAGIVGVSVVGAIHDCAHPQKNIALILQALQSNLVIL